MARRLSKRFSVILMIMVMALFTFAPFTVLAADQTSTSTDSGTEKVKPFPSQQPDGMLPMSSVYYGNFGNDNIQAQVAQDGRFNIGLKELNSNNWFNIMYAWNASPWSSFSTVKVDGIDEIYGNYPDGQFLESPANDSTNTKNESVWKTGDITVKQILQPGINPATGQPDALQIRYVITNTGTQNHVVGLRMMLDTMVNGNDQAPFKVPEKTGIASINYEKDYTGSDVPAFWQVFNTFDNPDISAQYTMNGRDATPPDRFAITYWGYIDDTKWDYAIHQGMYTGDSAVGMWWNPQTLAPGQQKVITTYYGRPGVGGDQALVLSGRQRLTYDEWSANPFNVIGYFTNNSGVTQDNVRLVLQADSGITLVDNDAEHDLGTVNIGATMQSTWALRATTAGQHHITVNAFANGSTVPFATAEYQIETLAPVVPTDITLSGTHGTRGDGTPMTGRYSPLTVNAHFENPNAVGVSLTATDGSGTTYTHEMSSTNGQDWSLTFTPSTVGLRQNPATITVTPRYADGSTGTPQQFPIVLIDPSGFIYNGNQSQDWRLPGATVTLQYYDPIIDTWVNISEDAYPGMLSPITNPQTSDNDGHYAWDVAEGQYRVLVSRPGFSTVTSREVTVTAGNPITDLDIALTPTDTVKPTITTSGVANGTTYTAPVNATFQASDDEAGVRSISYSVDGNTAVESSNTSASLPAISAVGQHTITLTATDYAGNVESKTIQFTIQNQQNDDMMPVVTAAITKTKSSIDSIQAARTKISNNTDKVLVDDDLRNALTTNEEAKEQVTRLEELLNAYSGTQIPSNVLTALRNYAAQAEQQNITANQKLTSALNTNSLSTAGSLAYNALIASNYSYNDLVYIQSYLKKYGVK